MPEPHFSCRSELNSRKDKKLFVIRKGSEQLNQQAQQDWEKSFGNKSVDSTIHVIGCSGFFHYFKDGNSFTNQFGNAEVFRRGCKDCCFIHYKDSIDAEKLLGKNRVQIFGKQFEVRRCNKYFNQVRGLCVCIPSTPISPTQSSIYQIPDEDSPSHMLNALNDDCLRQVFRQLSEYSDFLTVMRVCQRFSAVSKEYFSMRIRERGFSLSYFGEVLTLSQLESFLSDFGSSVHEAVLYFNNNFTFEPEIVLKLMNVHCKNLKTLEYNETPKHLNSPPYGIIVNKDLMTIRSLLPQLKSLTLIIHHDEFEQFTDFISDCSQLKTLTVHNFSDFQLKLPAKTFPELTELTFYNIPDESFMYDEFEQFSILNPQLECVGLKNFLFAECIGKNMKNLKVFHVMCGDSISHIDVTKSKFLNKNVELELDLYEIRDRSDLIRVNELNGNITRFSTQFPFSLEPNDLVSSVQSHTNVREMIFDISRTSGTVNINTFVPMLRHSKPKELMIYNEFQVFAGGSAVFFKFDQKDYDTILEVVKGRYKLEIYINNRISRRSLRYSLNKTIIFNEHPDWLTVRCTYEAYRLQI